MASSSSPTPPRSSGMAIVCMSSLLSLRLIKLERKAMAWGTPGSRRLLWGIMEWRVGVKEEQEEEAEIHPVSPGWSISCRTMACASPLCLCVWSLTLLLLAVAASFTRDNRLWNASHLLLASDWPMAASGLGSPGGSIPSIVAPTSTASHVRNNLLRKTCSWKTRSLSCIHPPIHPFTASPPKTWTCLNRATLSHPSQIYTDRRYHDFDTTASSLSTPGSPPRSGSHRHSYFLCRDSSLCLHLLRLEHDGKHPLALDVIAATRPTTSSAIPA